MHTHVDVFNFNDNKWKEKIDMPKEMAHSHLGIATDGRYIYIISGQYGPQCRGPTAHSFVLDTKTKKWSSMPSLPVPRYVSLSEINMFLIEPSYEMSVSLEVAVSLFALFSVTHLTDSDIAYLCTCRYAPATQLWRGRLHVMGGSKENRHTPALEHWSLAVKDGKALDKQWRTEIPIPRGGPHRFCDLL